MRLFDFGSNWQAFSEQRIDSRRLASAVESLRSLLQKDSLKGLSFLDVGCGSGLFSIAAYQLGASHVTGMDIDARCVEVAKQNCNRLVPGAAIMFEHASVLNPENLHRFGVFDIVYAWGSLHHTGEMWRAIQNVITRVSANGILVLAIYNRHFTSPVWKTIKWFYNQVPGIAQRFMVLPLAVVIYVAKFLVTWRNPLDKERGMDFWFDVIDWIGGYPYEYATPYEIETFVRAQGLVLRTCTTAQVPTGCNEYVFTRVASSSEAVGASYIQ